MSTNAEIIDEATGQLAEYFFDILADRQASKGTRVAKLFEDYADYLKTSTNAAQAFHDRKRRIAERLMRRKADR
jgi:hypothetical protein